jgi:hypothetical protein
MSSTTPCNPRHLIQSRYSQTSSGIALDNIIFDRESGKPFELVMSNTSLAFRTDWQHLSPSKLILLLKCLFLIQSLPETALQEAAEELEEISHFYANRSPQSSVPTIPVSRIRGKLRAIQVRPPIVLES